MQKILFIILNIILSSNIIWIIFVYGFAFSFKGNGDKGHMVILFRNKYNKLVFYDPQVGNIYNDLYLDYMEYHVDMGDYKIDYSPSVFRIDNTDLDIEIMNKISKPYQ